MVMNRDTYSAVGAAAQAVCQKAYCVMENLIDSYPDPFNTRYRNGIPGNPGDSASAQNLEYMHRMTDDFFAARSLEIILFRAMKY
jgi:hypothetical protein